MPIISARDNENNRCKKGNKIKDIKEQRGDTSYSESVRAKWFCCACKLDFLQLICKGSLIFKLNLQLALSVILKLRGLYEWKHVVLEGSCFKIWDLLSFLIWCSVLVLKWAQVLPM